MPDRAPHIRICSCEDTMPLDPESGKRGCRPQIVSTARQLCRAELDKFRAAAAGEGPLLVGCVQGGPLCSELVEERDGGITFVTIRETAGWPKAAAAAAPKMAALIAAAAEEAPAVPFVRFDREGVFLIYGRGERGI